jgi:threonine aldolase
MPRTIIDLRSDTVTKPTPEMRRAMAEAEVGDDVFGDDPTVRALEQRATDLLGKEAAVFLPTASMGNLAALMAHVPRGGEIIAGRGFHTVEDEAAGHAVVVGASIRTLDERPDGTLEPEAIVDAWRDATDPHHPITSLVCLENAHAYSMGQPLSAEYVSSVAALVHERGVPLHVDGARLFNAAVALGVPAADVVRDADSVQICLSKGLSCPIGALLLGDRSFIWRARRARKLLGGGMRQVGVIAAAGLVALRHGPDGMIDRLADDHANARRLAEGLARLDGVRSPGGIAQPTDGPLDSDRVRTNFVIFRPDRDRDAFLEALAGHGVLAVPYPRGTVRMVTHHPIGPADVDAVITAVEAALADVPARSAIATGSPA